jgi:competence protein ComEC
MLIRLVIAWLLGSLAAHLLAPPLLWLAAGAGLLFALALAMPRHTRLRAPLLLALALTLGALRYSAALPTLGPTNVATMADQGELALTGMVAEAPRHSADSQRLVLAVATVQRHGQPRPAEGRLLVVLPPYPAYHYGQRLLVRGPLIRPRTAERPGQFDYRAYLAHRNIFVVLQQPAEVRLLPGAGGNAPLAALLRFRSYCQSLLLHTLPQPQASLAVGILLGIRSSIPEEVYNAFSATGTSHILVISGWHFSLVVGLLSAFAERLRLARAPTLILSLLAMWLYACFAGASPAVLRAAAMASLAAIGRATERDREPWRLLALSCWLICLANPHTLWDVGFQLSALAITSLFAFSAPLDAWLAARRPFCWPATAPIRATLSATLAAQVLTLPLIIYHFGNLSIVAPLANVLLVPALPFAMAAGALSLLGALLWLPLGQLLAPLAWLPLTWLSTGVQLLATPRWAALQIPPFPLWLLLAYYVLVALVCWWRQRPARLPLRVAF